MSILQEFKTFAVKGNMIDMAVGIIIGAAFGKIIASLVADVIMPPLGLVIGGVNFADLGIILEPAEGEQPAVVLAYGKFVQSILDFVIIAVVIFMGIKGINRLKREERAAPPAPAAPTKDQELLSEIRDLLEAQQNKSA